MRFQFSCRPGQSAVWSLWVGLLLLGIASRARAAEFALDRYEPTPAGESFLAVQAPWYSTTRFFATGLTLDYGAGNVLDNNNQVIGKLLSVTRTGVTVLNSSGYLFNVNWDGSGSLYMPSRRGFLPTADEVVEEMCGATS